MSHIVLELIHQVLVNLVRTCNNNKTYVDADDQISVILTAAAFSILSTENRLKDYSPGQLLFGRDIIILIKHNVYWKFIRQKNQTQINKDNIRENKKQVAHDYNVIDKFMINNHAT